MRWPGWTRSPGSGSAPLRPSSRRSASTWPSSPPPAIWCRGPSCPRAPSSPGRSAEGARPARATEPHWVRWRLGTLGLRHLLSVEQGAIVRLLELRGRDAPAGSMKPALVPPLAAPADQLGLVKAVHSFGQSVVVGVPLGPHRPHCSLLGEAFGVADSEVLDAAIGVMDQSLQVIAPAPDGHLQGVQGEFRPK